MASVGRPLSIPTIVKRLGHLANAAPVTLTDQDMLISMIDALRNNPSPTASFYGSMVRDLDLLAQHVGPKLTDGDRKLLTTVIDGLARHEATIKPIKKITKSKLADRRSMTDIAKAHAASLQAAEMAVTEARNDRHRRASRETQIEAIAAAIEVLLDELIEGNSSDDLALCDTIAHLVMVLRNLV